MRWSCGVFLFLLACGGEPAPPDAPAPIPPPERTAAQDRALRALAAEVARSHTCDAVEGRFIPLPPSGERRAPGARAEIDGRFWVRECEVTRESERLQVALGGQGWRWANESQAGPLGTSFAVEGVVRFDTTIAVDGAIDLRYDEETQRLSTAFTPSSPARARVTPIGDLPVRAGGGWSGLLGGLGGLLGVDPQTEARQAFETRAAAILQRELGRGLTLSLDLCSGQPEALFGPLGDGGRREAPPYPDDGQRWLDNARVRLRAGALDVNGPWSGAQPLEVAFDVEDGGSAEVHVLCEREATAASAAFLARGALPSLTDAQANGRALPGAPLSLRVEAARCETLFVLATTPDELTRARYRVRHEGQTNEALLDCDG